MLKKLATVLCLVVLCLGLAIVAEGATASWTLSSDGVLTISSNDEMPNLELPRSEPISGIKSIVISDGITSIGDYAFSCCCYVNNNDPNRELVSVTIPDSVTSIGVGAFYSCDLASIAIPDKVTSIGDNAFNLCTTLKSITIPDSVTSIGSSAFFQCENLTSVILPEKITAIGANMFKGCTSLEHISIPEGVTTIDSSAFCDCISLESITIPESLTTINENAFSGCTNLAHVYYMGSESQFKGITIKTGNDKFTDANVTYIYPQVQTILDHVLKNLKLTTETTTELNVNKDDTVDVGDIQKIYYDSVSGN